MVYETLDAGLRGTVYAAEHYVVVLHAMAQDATAAMLTRRRQRVDSAFEGIEIITESFHRYLKRIFIRIATGFTGCHAVLQYDQKELILILKATNFVFAKVPNTRAP